MRTYECRDDSGHTMAIEARSPRAAALEYVDDGAGYSPEPETWWVTVAVSWTDDDGDECWDSHKIAIAPEEPECPEEDEHRWASPYEILGGLEENPGVWANGGGVVITEVCLHCGCSRRTDTWAQDPTDGEQGLKSVRYSPAEYAAEVEALREPRCRHCGDRVRDYVDADARYHHATEDVCGVCVDEPAYQY